MAEILELRDPSDPKAARALPLLERGGVVLFPQLPFELDGSEEALLDPGVLNQRSKNVSYDPATGRLGGAEAEGGKLASLSGMLRRYGERADQILRSLTPIYTASLQRRRISFRPGAIEVRALSPRKDDKRLHVDAFPANPVQGRRIFRVFTNANPSGESRIWKIGDDDFTAFAQSFRSRIKPRPGGAWREALGLTKGRRTAYDSAMLQLHDTAKSDDAWQSSTSAKTLEFPPGSTWVVYTDSVLHAALKGQHAFEQTYLLPIEAMADPSRSPLQVLERLTGRSLV